MSELTDFLTQDYALHFGVEWQPNTMKLRMEKPASVCFEIEDKLPAILQPAGKGVSVIRRKETAVEVLDIEDFTRIIHGTDNTPNSCDFIISPCVGNDFLVFNELTRSKSEYILRFDQPKTGEQREGKLETARHQLTETINRFYAVSTFCDKYTEKIALFSCRLSDKRSNGIMARSAKSFCRSIAKLQKIRLHEQLPHGFIFKMRVYNAEYRL